MRVIIVTGTPCTGKTTLAKKLANKLNLKYIDVTKIIKKYALSEGYDKKRGCKIIDVENLNKKLIAILNQSKKKFKKNLKNKKTKGLIIDSHLSHYLPKKYVDLCIVAKCSLKELKRRLKKRGYSKNKIRENLDCEVFDICYNEALESKHKVIVIDTTKGMSSINKIIQKMRNY